MPGETTRIESALASAFKTVAELEKSREEQLNIIRDSLMHALYLHACVTFTTLSTFRAENGVPTITIPGHGANKLAIYFNGKTLMAKASINNSYSEPEEIGTLGETYSDVKALMKEAHANIQAAVPTLKIH